MGRLTQKDDKGNWSLKNIPWGELFEGRRIEPKARQAIYGALCKLKDYEDTGMSPYQMENWWYELEDMAGHVCDDLCRYRQELQVQEELEEMCEFCPVSACRKKLLGLTESQNMEK